MALSFIRRRLLLALATIGASGLVPPMRSSLGEEEAITFGAIRWDAWYDSDDQIGRAVEASLGPEQFHNRMPFFGEVVDRDHVHINGNNQSIIDREIHFADEIGLTYWAYCWYPDDSPMQIAWHLHQSSSVKNLVNWCMIWQLSHLGPPATFTSYVQKYVTWFQQRNYQAVAGGRPLVYLYIDDSSALAKHWGGNWGNLRNGIETLRAACSKAGVKSPYVVIMNGVPSDAADAMHTLNADAISNYIAWIPHVKAAPFSELAKYAALFWAKMSETGCSIVPIAMTGWDTRPRKSHVPFWEQLAQTTARDDNYVVRGTPKQIRDLINAAAKFARSRPELCPARSVLIYSWNECDEGGSTLIPTFGSKAEEEIMLRPN